MLDTEEETTWSCAACGDDQSEADERNTTADGDVCGTCRSDYSICEDCEDLVNSEDVYTVERGSRWVCSDCLDSHYSECENCGESTHSDDMTTVYGGDSEHDWCGHCRDSDASYCDQCGEYYSHDDDHSHTCDCTHPPMMRPFTVPTEGGASTSTADVDITVSIDAGIPYDILNRVQAMLTETANAEVRATLPEGVDLYTERGLYPLWSAIQEVYGVGPEWKTSQGTYPKRLRRAIYNTTKRARIDRLTGRSMRAGHWQDGYLHYCNENGPWMDEDTAKRHARGWSMPDEMVAAIGALTERYSRPVDTVVQVTRDLNMSAYDFGNDDSCWWGLAANYGHSRCTFKASGGIGVRALGQWGSCEGRFWVLPLAPDADGDLRVCPDESRATAWLVFNSYGVLSETAAPKVWSAMTGLRYMDVEVDGTDMYINEASTYLFAAPEVLSAVTCVNLDAYDPCGNH